MLFMVTNRRVRDGRYGDEARANHRFEYQYAYNNQAHGQDAFESKGKRGFETALLAELCRLRDAEGINTPKVGIYLHGFNNDYQDSIDELWDLHQHLARVTDKPPVIVGFSWPSSGKTVSYLSDRDEVRDSVGAFTRFVLDINDLAHRNEQGCFSTTFCIAHSMGSYLLRKGLEYLSDNIGSPVGRMLFDETVLLAPDIASKDIERDGKGRYIAQFSRRVHVYYSPFDRALKASSAKRFGGNRLGRHGADDYANLPGNVVLVDAKTYANSDAIDGCTDRVGEQVSVHSSHRYHAAILSDMVETLASVDRDLIKGRMPIADDGESRRNHYRLVPPA